METTRTLATIGYESATLDDVIGRLKAAHVERVIDVRAIAASRRAGFSKTILGASLNEAGIEYVHLRRLGSPKPARQAARAGRVPEMRTLFEAYLEEPEAQLALIEAGALAAERKSALLCYEHAACGCHRAIVAERLQAARGFVVEDL